MGHLITFAPRSWRTLWMEVPPHSLEVSKGLGLRSPFHSLAIIRHLNQQEERFRLQISVPTAHLLLQLWDHLPWLSKMPDSYKWSTQPRFKMHIRENLDRPHKHRAWSVTVAPIRAALLTLTQCSIQHRWLSLPLYQGTFLTQIIKMCLLHLHQNLKLPRLFHPTSRVLARVHISPSKEAGNPEPLWCSRHFQQAMRARYWIVDRKLFLASNRTNRLRAKAKIDR
jgi:hypothetical protein